MSEPSYIDVLGKLFIYTVRLDIYAKRLSECFCISVGQNLLFTSLQISDEPISYEYLMLQKYLHIRS